MPQFEYTAKSRDGKNSAGFVDAADRRGAIAAVERLGLIPLNVAQRSDSAKARPKAAKGAKSGSSAFKLARPNHMSANEVMLFTGELADLIEGGMTLGNALNCLASRGDGQSGPSQVITALRDAIMTAKEVVGTHGVYNFKPGGLYGVDERARVIVKPETGQWKLVP